RLWKNDSEQANFKSPQSATVVYWENASVQLQWRSGDSLGITLRQCGYVSDVKVGEVLDESPLAILTLSQNRSLASADRSAGRVIGEPFVRLEVAEITAAD